MIKDFKRNPEMMEDKANGIIEFNDIKDFALDNILECGQCFRWNDELEDGTYIGIVEGYLCRAKFDGTTLTLETNGGGRDFWFDYFDLKTDYSNIKSELIRNDDRIEPAIKAGSGIRILRQNFWEVLISFIISQNNNIPRIKKCIEALSVKYGEYLGHFYGRERYAFPLPSELAESSINELEGLKLGYRCEYILSAAKRYLTEGAPSGSSEEIYKTLMSYHGIGTKVANCIGLFGLHNLSSFPIDVWVRRIMHDMYGFKENDIKGMQNFAKGHFGELGGIAQQYLFNYYTKKE